MQPDWMIALIVDDPSAIKVAAAYYALPRSKRRDLYHLSQVSGVTQEVQSILTRLDAAGMLRDEPPAILVELIQEWVARRLTGK